MIVAPCSQARAGWARGAGAQGLAIGAGWEERLGLVGKVRVGSPVGGRTLTTLALAVARARPEGEGNSGHAGTQCG